MNAARYFGLYRPWGFKHNIYNLFYTRHPIVHFEKQRKIYGLADENGLFELSEMMGLNVPKSVTIYSTESYHDYKKLHKKLAKHFENQGNSVSSLKLRGKMDPSSFYFPGKYISFETQPIPNDLDAIIKKLSLE